MRRAQRRASTVSISTAHRRAGRPGSDSVHRARRTGVGFTPTNTVAAPAGSIRQLNISASSTNRRQS